MTSKISALIASTSLVLMCTVSAAAFADGMPFKEAKPQPNLTPMDKTLDTQNKQPPVSVVAPAAQAAPAPAPAPAPVAEAPPPAPAPAPAPVPESRIVDVQPNTSFFGLSVGMYDPITHGKQAPSFNVEWQPGVKIVGYLQPIFGAMATTSGSLLGYGGIGVPFNVTDHVFVMPSVAIGAYKRGNGYDLDHVAVYRIGSEFAYQFDDKSRLGLNLHVITNAETMQRKDRTEVAAVTYTMPFDFFSHPSDTPTAQMPAPLLMPSAGDTTTTSKPLPHDLP